jgi:hypothetical protein
MNLESSIDGLEAQERIIAEGIVDVASELRLVDADELVLLIRNNQQANISDLVNSSSELYFKAGTLKYGLVSGCQVGWDRSPVVLFDMEFGHASVSAFFRLMLGRSRGGVEVLDIVYDESELSSSDKMRRLADAIADARLPK